MRTVVFPSAFGHQCEGDIGNHWYNDRIWGVQKRIVSKGCVDFRVTFKRYCVCIIWFPTEPTESACVLLFPTVVPCTIFPMNFDGFAMVFPMAFKGFAMPFLRSAVLFLLKSAVEISQVRCAVFF